MPRCNDSPCRCSDGWYLEQQRAFDSDSGSDLRDSRRRIYHRRFHNDHLYCAYGMQYIYDNICKCSANTVYGYPDLCGAISGADGSCYRRFLEYDQRAGHGNSRPTEPSGRRGDGYSRRHSNHLLYAVYRLHGHKCSDD